MIPVRGLANTGWILVIREVLAMSINSSVVISFFCLKASTNLRVSYLASSIPSTRILGWTPSPRYLSAYLMSSPMKRTLEVVPSPTISS